MDMIKRAGTALVASVIFAAVTIFQFPVSAAEKPQALTDTKPPAKGTPETPSDAKAIEGAYYRGNGLSYNLELTLKAGGQYTAKWDSCLYKSGEESGTWKLSDKRILFAPAIEGEMLRGRLETLDVLKFEGEWILVPVADAERKFHDILYEREGVTPLSCFQRIELAGDWHFENGATGEFQELELDRQRTFTWVIRDEPLRSRNTYHGKWQIRDSALHLSIVNGQSESGEPTTTRQSSYVFSITPDRESLLLRNTDFRMTRNKATDSLKR
jgi:hypothetical protein